MSKVLRRSTRNAAKVKSKKELQAKERADETMESTIEKTLSVDSTQAESNDSNQLNQENIDAKEKSAEETLKLITNKNSSVDDTQTETNAISQVKSNNSNEDEKVRVLTPAEKARIERNRQKALLLRQARLSCQQLQGSNTKTSGCSRIIDTGGGFFLEEDDNAVPKKVKRVEEPAPVIAGEMTSCLECDQLFLDSYLMSTYDYPACDNCKDLEEKHAVITKTDSRETYLLSETDLTLREPILKFVVRKNPRNHRWGDMKLYLKLQVEKRALEVWGSLEAIEEERESREKKREIAKRKKFNKKLKQLRQEVRSSLYEAKTAGHVHEYGVEAPCEEDEDMWQKICSLCGHRMTFEKM
ncbi:DNA repair protein complementing XP-A cells-like [Clavelina lepadiformis]|uniref:DNA repair protein complementing XP-A cells-like n=1 Tax=Clavelina lepadiformis TaxID=159417 RepID=UPI00404373F9